MRWKMVSITLIILVIIVIGVVQYYRYIQKPVWQQETTARQTALQETDMVNVNKVEKYSGANTYMIVHGVDEADRNMIVWVGVDIPMVHAAYADEGIAANLLLSEWREQHPDAKLKYMIPGVYQEQYVWVFYYRVKEEQGRRYYYDYYNFENGEKIQTLTMSL